MANSLSAAYIGAGVAKGGQEVFKYAKGREDRELNRNAARQRQEKAGLQLQAYKAEAPLRKSQQELELAQTKSSLRKLQATNLQSDTFNAFRAYEADGDVKHINNFLTRAKQNPTGVSNYGDTVRVDTLTRTPETEAMLRQQGFTDLDNLFADPEQVKDFVIETMQDGSRQLTSMTTMQAETGYTQYMTQQELANMTKLATLQRALRGTESAETGLIAKMVEEEGISTYEATKRYYGIKNAGKTTGSKVERVADDIMAENPEISRTDAIKQATRDTEQRTAGMKDIDESESVRAELDESGFFEADVSDKVNRRKFGPKIAALEKLTGQKLSNEDKRVARDLRSLIKLGGTAGSKLTGEETGFFDRTLGDVKQYFSDEIPGTEGVAAYETFRNVFRNALYGASLTSTEVSAFNKAAGNLKQKAGPVLQKLLVQIEDIKSQLSSVYQMNDEYVSHYYLGSSLEEVDQVIEALEQRVNYFKSLTKETDVKVPTKALPKKTLEEIFK